MAKGILKKGKLVMVLAAIGSCLCLIGCAAKEDATEAVNYASEDSSLTYAVHTELDGHAIELPQFTSTHDSAVIEELNQDIMDGPGAIYEKDKDGKVQGEDKKSYLAGKSKAVFRRKMERKRTGYIYKKVYPGIIKG
mgnify:CR=1 FL=1